MKILVVILLFITFDAAAQNKVYFCKDYDHASNTEIGKAFRFNKGSITLILNTMQPVNDDKLVIEIYRFHSFEKMIAFDVDPNKNYLVLDEPEKLTFYVSGYYTVKCYRNKDYSENIILAENSFYVNSY